MAKRWNSKEEDKRRKELKKLYVEDNLSIRQVARILHIGQSTVYDRLLRLGIKPDRSRKSGFNNRSYEVKIPSIYSARLAEFIGIMLGDGHITKTQVTVTLGSKEIDYVRYVASVIFDVFKINPKTIQLKTGYRIVYFGSTEAVRWLLTMGLVFNKVKSQVDVPEWIYHKKLWIKHFLRGFFDTDGSTYKLRYGMQLSFTNKSLPMLNSIIQGLVILGFSPSRISLFRTYLTKKEDVVRFFKEVEPKNLKHVVKFQKLVI